MFLLKKLVVIKLVNPVNCKLKYRRCAHVPIFNLPLLVSLHGSLCFEETHLHAKLGFKWDLNVLSI
jgi:hypothetical protein